MNKNDYILRSLSKIKSKRWEYYVITRIFHRLDDLEIEFICQQCIRKDDKKIYLVDLYFPQLGIYVEIDEGHHEGDLAKIADAERRFDIEEKAGLIEHRIPVTGVGLAELNAKIDEMIACIKEKKAKLGEAFKPWAPEHRFTAKPHLEKRFLKIGPDAAFRTHKDALECFGYTKGHYQRAVWKLPPEVWEELSLSQGSMIWFPKLNRPKDIGEGFWANTLSDDGKLITEQHKTSGKHYKDKWTKRIVMASSRDDLNRTLYRFVGVFENNDPNRDDGIHEFKRIGTKVSTFPVR